MPRAINDYEKHLLQLGHIVAVNAHHEWLCKKCGVGSLLLTRQLDDKGGVGPASFVCNKCNDQLTIYPEKSGGVQPALKGVKVEINFGEGQSGTGYDGRWK